MKNLDFQKHVFGVVKRLHMGKGGFIIRAVCENKAAAEKYVEELVRVAQEKAKVSDNVSTLEMPEIITLPLWKIKKG
jgi:hypothetical protein